MSLIVEVTINGSLHRVSMEGVALEHYWDAMIISFDPPHYELSQLWGGYAKMTFGSVVFSPDLFRSDWPPPQECPIVARHTDSDESSAIILFDGVGYLREFSREQVTYDLYAEKFTTELLEEDTDYDGNVVPLPRAFGTIQHQNPVRLPDDASGQPCYHKAYLTGVVGTDWHVYDDGVNVDLNVVDNGDGTFSLTATPVGEVTISGTGSQTDLVGIFSWACGASYLNLTLDSTYAESPSPGVNYWAKSQKPLIDFLDELAAFYGHLFYVREGTLYLVGMAIDNGVRSITEFEFFPSTYEYLSPIATIKAEWIIRDAVSDRTGSHIKDYDKEVVRTGSYSYGTEISVTPYHDDYATIAGRLDDILDRNHMVRARLHVPLEGSLPVPGERITWSDSSLVQTADAWIRARSVTYDFDELEVIIEGEGEVS